MDRLSTLLEQFRVKAQLFHAGPLCGTTRFDALPGRAFLHVLRRGSMSVVHQPSTRLPRQIELSEPTLLFYPTAVTHRFINPPTDGSDLTCATLSFDGDAFNPLVRALPALTVLPLHRIEGLDQSLALLFAETDRVRCGQRLLADRLFEVVLIQLLRWMIDHTAEAGLQKGLLGGLSDPRLAAILVAMHQAPGDAWPLERMASVAGMSRSAFVAAFKDGVGQTPGDYLTDWRLSLAQSRIRRGQPVALVADALGYANASALSRMFRNKVGCSPRDWLNRERAAQG